MSFFERFFHGEHGAARSYLFGRLFLSLLALDTWLVMMAGASRYGSGGFNVAHFAWLDRLLPVPSAGLYLGVLVLVGLLALVIALTGIRRGAVLCLFTLYTLSWAMSMLDSYQHHYLISLILLCLAFFPQTVAREPGGSSAPALRTGWGYGLLGASMAIVYVYAAIAKMDASWMQGHTLRRFPRVAHLLSQPASLAEGLGLGRDRFFALFATSMVVLELFLALSCLLAVVGDRQRRPWVAALCTLAFGAALALHGGSEIIGLKIGWFSYYMLLLAVCLFLPLPVVDGVARLLTAPARTLAKRRRASPPRLATLALAIACALLVDGIGRRLDLPGGRPACAVAGVALLAATGWMLLRPSRRDPHWIAMATAVAAAALWLAVSASSVRFDYYRTLGGDFRRRGELAAALEAYRKAERYAPPGKTRAGWIAELERSLGR